MSRQHTYLARSCMESCALRLWTDRPKTDPKRLASLDDNESNEHGERSSPVAAGASSRDGCNTSRRVLAQHLKAPRGEQQDGAWGRVHDLSPPSSPPQGPANANTRRRATSAAAHRQDTPNRSGPLSPASPVWSVPVSFPVCPVFHFCFSVACLL